jgi:CDP-diacylglycerol--glycerol-3-phosphate 3-phosphatidyltransferase
MIRHVPNIITLVRILFAPAFMWMLLTAGDDLSSPLRWWGAVLFIVGLATDGIDGAIARRFNAVSDFGKLMDPIADKVLTLGALVTLSLLGELPWWVTGLIAFREIGITVYRLAVLSDHVIPASRGGKLKTVTQFVAISLALLPLPGLWGSWMNAVNTGFMALALVITLVSGLDYVVSGVRLSRVPAAAGVIHELVQRGLTIAVAESLTGGLVLAELTAVPGASVVVRGGIVAYSADLKRELLHVPAELLAAHGTVHPLVAEAMALGVAARAGASIGVATTGVAGPETVDGHPVGTVFIAVTHGGVTRTADLALSGSREQIRRTTARAALTLITDLLTAETPLNVGEKSPE